MKYILNNGIQPIPETSFFKKLFCRHKETMTGEHCSSLGMVIISGSRQITACKKCGKVLEDTFTPDWEVWL